MKANDAEYQKALEDSCARADDLAIQICRLLVRRSGSPKSWQNVEDIRFVAWQLELARDLLRGGS